LFLGIFGILCIIAGIVFAAEFHTLPGASAQDEGGTSATPAVNVPMTPSGANPFREVIKQIKPAVVNIETERRAGSGAGGMDELPFPFFGPPSGPDEFGDEGPETFPTGGSGFIIDPEGYIITNNHVIQDSVTITVTLDDGRQFDAELVGSDPSTDVAVIKIDGQAAKIPTSLRLGDSDGVEIGDWVIAVGSPLGLQQTVTVGVVSAKNRQEVNIQGSKYSDFIQTDAAINFGNSGGPLLTIDGRVVGMNTAIAGGPNVSGIGFAVPANKIKFVYENLRTHGKVLRGYIGIYVGEVSRGLAKANDMESAYGALVTQVDPDTPAGRAGIKFGDIVVGVDGTRVMNRQHLVNMVAEKGVGKVVKLQILRDGGQTELTVKTEQRPDEVDEAKPTAGPESAPGAGSPRPSVMSA
ncbi:MAG TPA: trypsin-like peptidase domain-containing protein, partial [bacterium]|nr:trypsin-like peptidase domain-containing protein [bacterium]